MWEPGCAQHCSTLPPDFVACVAPGRGCWFALFKYNMIPVPLTSGTFRRLARLVRTHQKFQESSSHRSPVPSAGGSVRLADGFPRPVCTRCSCWRPATRGCGGCASGDGVRGVSCEAEPGFGGTVRRAGGREGGAQRLAGDGSAAGTPKMQAVSECQRADTDGSRQETVRGYPPARTPHSAHTPHTTDHTTRARTHTVTHTTSLPRPHAAAVVRSMTQVPGDTRVVG